MTRRAPRDTRLRCDDCGYTTPLTSAGMAAKSLRVHSCDLQRERDRRKAAVAARKAADGPRRDCHHPIAHHEHGTRNAYVLDRCRCRACRDANSGHQARIDRLKAYGQFDPFVDAAPVLEHVRTLQASGMGLKRIAHVAGVAHGGLTKLVYGKRQADGTYRPTKRMRKETAARVLAVKPELDLLAPATVVDATGARRRLRALVAHGWSMRQLARRMGMTESNFGRVIKGDDQMHASTARKARDLYDQLWDVPPRADDQRSRISVSRSKRYAAEHGWLPALAWDDDTIDDPGAWADLGGQAEDDDVDPVVVERLVAGEDWRRVGATRAERVAAAQLMPSINEAERRLGLRHGRDFTRQAAVA